MPDYDVMGEFFEDDCKRCEGTGEVYVYDGVGLPYASWCPSCEPERAARHRAERAKELAIFRSKVKPDA